MLICRIAEGVHGQRKVGNPWSSCCRNTDQSLNTWGCQAEPGEI